MVKIFKSEWHQVEKRNSFELDLDTLEEIYPDATDKELKAKLKGIEDGVIEVSDVIDDAYNEGVDIDWDHEYDDWWTDRKGGYDITYDTPDKS